MEDNNRTYLNELDDGEEGGQVMIAGLRQYRSLNATLGFNKVECF